MNLQKRIKRSKWISVRKQMPVEGKAAMILFLFNGDLLFTTFTGHHEKGVWFYYDIQERRHRVLPTAQGTVTHWMQLPQLPIIKRPSISEVKILPPFIN